MKKFLALLLASVLFWISFVMAPAALAGAPESYYPDAEKNYEYYGSPYFSSTGLTNDAIAYQRRVEIERASKQPTWHYDADKQVTWACNWVYKRSPGGWFCEKIYKFAPSYPNRNYYPYQCSYGYRLTGDGQFCERIKAIVKTQAKPISKATPVIITPTNYVVVDEAPQLPAGPLPKTGPEMIFLLPLLAIAPLIYVAKRKKVS